MKKILLVLTTIFTFSFGLELIDEARIYQEQGNIKEALDLYKIAASKQNEEAIIELGKIYYQGKVVKRDYKKAYRYFRKAHLLNNTEGSYYFAVLLSNKRSSYLDYEKSFEIFKALADNGNAKAQNRTGMFLAYGIGSIKKDYKKAVKYFEDSAKQKNLSGECNLAVMYASGKGVFPNFGRAHAFAKKGYEKKHPVCVSVWKKYKLYKYPEDKGFQFKSFTKPIE